jgi:hypothetical protein
MKNKTTATKNGAAQCSYHLSSAAVAKHHNLMAIKTANL